MIIGRVSDIRPIAGNVRGPQVNPEDTDPGDVGIDSGFTFDNFRVGTQQPLVCVVNVLLRVSGDRVLAYWWARWWRGKVHSVAARARTLAIRFDWSNRVISGYKPRCVHKLDR